MIVFAESVLKQENLDDVFGFRIAATVADKIAVDEDLLARVGLRIEPRFVWYGKTSFG